MTARKWAESMGGIPALAVLIGGGSQNCGPRGP